MHSTGQRLLYIQVSRSIYKWDDHGNSTYIKEGAYPLHSHHISVISPCMSKPGICSCFTFSLNLQGKKNQTKTEQTWHQDQLKWEEMQSPKYLSYLDLGLLTNLHWDMVTHSSTWREKQCLLKFKKKKKNQWNWGSRKHCGFLSLSELFISFLFLFCQTPECISLIEVTRLLIQHSHCISKHHFKLPLVVLLFKQQHWEH